MKIVFCSLGCRLNYAELEEIKENAKNLGIEIVLPKEKSDILVLSACGVTQKAERQTKQRIRSLSKNSETTIVIGCLKETIPEIHYYCRGPQEAIKKIKEILKEKKYNPPTQPPIFCDPSLRQDPEGQVKEQAFNEKIDRTRVFIKIQDTCPFNCTFCISKKLRPKTPISSIPSILKKIKEKEKQGFQEIILTGLNILSFKNLNNLIKKILAETSIPRIRFGSIDPRLVTNEFIKLFKDERLCPHLHISVQSGSEKILKLMKRNYNSEAIEKIIKKFRKINPNFSFSADIIVGFPNETEKDFKDTCNLIEKNKFLKIHAFPFSPRKNTEAHVIARSPQATWQSREDIKNRIKLLEKVSKESREKYLKNILGLCRPVLFEYKKDGYYYGYTPEFLRIKHKSSKNLVNKIKTIKL